MGDENRSQQATPRRRQKAREEGRVARGRDLAPSLAIATVVFISAWQVGNGTHEWRLMFRDLVALSATRTAGPAVWLSALHRVSMYWLYPALGGALLISALGIAAQGGVVFAPALLKPQWNRIDPFSHMKQLFSTSTLLGLAKSLLPTSLIAYFVIDCLRRDWVVVCAGTQLHVRSLAGLAGTRVFEIGWKCGLVMLCWSAIDFLVQKRKHESDLRMTHQEVREEMKESEGNPQVKGRIRKLQRQVRRKRMLEDVARAAVVITNPTEYAIALEYNDRLAAPVVVAKGRNLLAQQIKQAARWHGIPAVENVPLAHSLYRTVEVGQTIPAKLYAAVAEVLAFILRAQARVAEAH